jgi:mRNA interferase MazF
MKLERGVIVIADLDPTEGHEQRGRRPCIVVSPPEVVDRQRFPLIAVVPVTRTPGRGALYPSVTPAPRTGLREVSYALVDHVRSIDKRRVVSIHGPILADELDRVSEGLMLYLGLERSPVY